MFTPTFIYVFPYICRLSSDGRPLTAVICTAGGWVGGGAGSEAIAESLGFMESACIHTAVAAAHVAAHKMKEGGTLVLTGSAAALSPTPGMLAYGMAKASTHFLAQSLASDPTASGLPSGAKVFCLLPKVIDTPDNRKYMAGPGVDTSAWTPPAHIAAEMLRWCSSRSSRSSSSSEGEGGETSLPPSGSLVVADTKAGKTAFVVA
jgi:dihydropteridine reductase